MIIDTILAKLWQIGVYYGNIALETPTHFGYQHWMIFTAICVVIGVLSMRGFGSRKNY